MIKQAFLVAGLGYGDCGKGATTDWLVWKHGAGLVVRYNGGPQAGHSVVTPDGRHHCFSQFGSGTFHAGVRTHLSRFMLVNPLNMMTEEEHLREVGITDAWERTTVDGDALIVTPFHVSMNKFAALSQGFKNTCGQGVGVCRGMHLFHGDRVLFAKDLANPILTSAKLRFMRDQMAAECEKQFKRVPELLTDDHAIDICSGEYQRWPVKIISGMPTLPDCTVFEGAQGVLLDEKHGDDGFNTWTNTTFGNAYALLDDAKVSEFDTEIKRVGVIRTYYTRHGAGPFPTEDQSLKYPEPHNDDLGMQGTFRLGTFDLKSFNRAVNILGGIDVLAISHSDCARIPVEATMAASKIIRAFGPTRKDRKEVYAAEDSA